VLAVPRRALQQELHPGHDLLRADAQASGDRDDVERERHAAATAGGEDPPAVVWDGAGRGRETDLHDRLLVTDLHERDVLRGLDDVLEAQEAERERDDARRRARDRGQLVPVHDERDRALRRGRAPALGEDAVAVEPGRDRARDAPDLGGHRALAMPARIAASSIG
jgi:hypothetical protein